MAICKGCTIDRHDRCEDVWDSEAGRERKREKPGCPCQHKVNPKPTESALPG